MAIRNEALACPEFCRLKAAYDDRKAVLRAWRDAGKQVVCVAGGDVPEELILAAGMQPMRITGFYGGERPSAEKYLEYSFGAIWKGIWETITEDYAGLMDHLVFSSSSDMLLKLFYYCRALKRLEPERALPELRYLDFELTERRFKTQERNERELREFRETLEQWSGREITDTALREAIALCNDYRAALRDFCALRGKERCRVTGSEALTVIGGSLFLAPGAATAVLRALTAAAADWPEVDLVRTYYVGSPQETTEVYELAEAAGLNIVGEDHDLGDRVYDAPVRTDVAPIPALAHRLLDRLPSSEKGSIARRVQAIGDRLRETGAAAFLTYMNNNDEAYVWDYPSLRSAVLEPAGIPSLTVQKQTWPLTEPEELSARFRELAEQAREVRHG